jgi:hypothetical protein
MADGSPETGPPVHPPPNPDRGPANKETKKGGIAMRIARILPVAIVLILVGMMLVAVDNEPANFKIEYFKTNHACVPPGTKVTLTWDYSPDLAAALTEQTLEFMTVSFKPGGMDRAAKTLTNDERSYSFVFTGTVGIKLTAKAGTKTPVSAYLEVRTFPCTEKYGKTYHLEGRFAYRGTLATGATMAYPMFYPDLGYYRIMSVPGGCCPRSPRTRIVDSFKIIEFTTCFAAYDGAVKYDSADRDRFGYNQIIDSLSSMLSTSDSFRAFTSDPAEHPVDGEYFRVFPVKVGYFGMHEGCSYPALESGTPADMTGMRINANVIIYGAALVPDGALGDPYNVEDPEGEMSAFTTYDVTGVQPVFIAIPMYFPERFFPRAGIQPIILDIQTGNLKQGLICGINNDGVSKETGIDSLSYSSWNWQVDGKPSDYIEGYIKAATVGSEITLFSGDTAHVFVIVGDITFKVPFYPDDKIEEFFPTPPPVVE